MNIVVASGKGGTGKTMVSVNLAWTIAQSEEITLIDCDAEEPNVHLFYPEDENDGPVTVKVPEVDSETCTLCGACGEFCRYGAISVLTDTVMFQPHLCHSCGGCMLSCPVDAITEVPRRIGMITRSRPSSTLTVISGILDEGEIAAPAVIKAAKEAGEWEGVSVLDGPPGSACPVIETMESADVCILVTESTPSGLADLKRAARLAEALGVPAGVVINRSDGEDAPTLEFCAEEGLPVLLTIPFDREIAAIQNRGAILCSEKGEWREAFFKLYENALAIAGGIP
ncbi:ATP-binding protein [Methanogenium organophilum]|uniref:ATP-binding protein n=1 Tax=Methanogenium organophilum TaxID=2199 RepID=A0A9X9T8H2_METOG|nr:ATP-binding protein [Methanogenium organophilum]WAI01690.1 ATP-binding protein [Methanogenium organophilum]